MTYLIKLIKSYINSVYVQKTVFLTSQYQGKIEITFLLCGLSHRPFLRVVVQLLGAVKGDSLNIILYFIPNVLIAFIPRSIQCSQ
jgi:hypothetical protein